MDGWTLEPGELEQWFENLREKIETSYLSHKEPWMQSGMSGPEERWISLRKPVAECIERSGSFLDIGCANGYLLECCIRWTAERSIRIDPYGLDISARLVELVRERLPHWADHLYTGNAIEWTPPHKFDFVRTELVYVPAEHEREYIEHLLGNYLKKDGRLLVANYTEDHPHPEKTVFAGNHPTKHILDYLVELDFEPVAHRDGYDPIRGRKIRIAILTNEN